MKEKILLGLGSIAVFSLFSWFVYSKGQSDIQVKWDREKKAQQEATQAIQEKYDALFDYHSKYVALISETLRDKENEKDKVIADIADQYADGMRRANDRASVYRRKAEAGEAESRSLASHAAELDRSLVEGKRVAAELAATVRLRDDQLKALANQIRADRLVIGELND